MGKNLPTPQVNVCLGGNKMEKEFEINSIKDLKDKYITDETSALDLERHQQMYEVVSAIDGILPLMVVNEVVYYDWASISLEERDSLKPSDHTEPCKANLLALRNDVIRFISSIGIFGDIMSGKLGEKPIQEIEIPFDDSNFINNMNTIMKYCVSDEDYETWMCVREEFLAPGICSWEERVVYMFMAFRQILRTTKIEYHPSRN